MSRHDEEDCVGRIGGKPDHFRVGIPHMGRAAVAGAGVLLPFTPLGALFDLQPLPPLYYAFLVATVAAYLAAVELAKQAIYRRSVVIRLK